MYGFVFAAVVIVIVVNAAVLFSCLLCIWIVANSANSDFPLSVSIGFNYSLGCCCCCCFFFTFLALTAEFHVVVVQTCTHIHVHISMCRKYIYCLHSKWVKSETEIVTLEALWSSPITILIFSIYCCCFIFLQKQKM